MLHWLPTKNHSESAELSTEHVKRTDGEEQKPRSVTASGKDNVFKVLIIADQNQEIPIGKLIVSYYHKKFHQSGDTVKPKVKYKGLELTSQRMGDLPRFHSQIQPSPGVYGVIFTCVMTGPRSYMDVVCGAYLEEVMYIFQQLDAVRMN